MILFVSTKPSNDSVEIRPAYLNDVAAIARVEWLTRAADDTELMNECPAGQIGFCPTKEIVARWMARLEDDTREKVWVALQPVIVGYCHTKKGQEPTIRVLPDLTRDVATQLMQAAEKWQ